MKRKEAEMPDSDLEGFPNHEVNVRENRRTTSRLPFTGLRLKIKKRGAPHLAQEQDCDSIDLSNSGIAFTSNSLQLSELEKVDFTLHFQNQTIRGTAMVRYAQAGAGCTRYGLMFLQTLPQLDAVIGGENLTTSEIRQLATAMAEQIGYKIQDQNLLNLRIARRRQRFCDALNAYFERLSEMGVRLPAVDPATPGWQPARAAVAIDEENGCVGFFRYSADHDELVAERIQFRQAENQENPYFASESGAIFHNLFEVLGYISDEIALLAKLAHFYPLGMPGNHPKP
jgi:hypothetical protein